MIDPVPPASTRGRLFFSLWKYLPALTVAALVALTVVLAGLVGAKKERLEAAKRASRAEQPVRVNAVVLALQPVAMEEVLNLPGTVEPWIRLELLAKVSGAIAEVLVREGDAVTAGQVLARIETDDYRVALDAARAAHDLARAEYERGRVMRQTNVISVAGLESLAARQQTAAAELERARLQLDRCTITAPMDGVVKRLDAKVGFFLNVGDPMAELLQIDRVKAVVGIPESDVDAVRRLAQVELTIQALADHRLTGRVHYLAPAPDSGAFLFRLELAVDNPGHRILPGMFFRCRIVKQQFPQALAVPIYAVISRGDEQFVMVAEGEIARKRPVRLGIVEGWQVQVVEGLKAGDRVLVEGHREVEENQPITVIKTLDDPAGLGR